MPPPNRGHTSIRPVDAVRDLVRRGLLHTDAERAHDLGVNLLALAGRQPALGRLMFGPPPLPRPELNRRLLGLQFANPVGIAAGLDKQAVAVDGLFALGFGWVEVGTVTPLPQAGNPKPRLFRLPEHRAIINRMGFNSIGIETFVRNLSRQRAVADEGKPISVNIGKNKATPNQDAASDYVRCLDAVFEFADIVTVNLSSPNTPELRSLQFGNELARLLEKIGERREQLNDRHRKRVPLLVKIAPDEMTTGRLQDIVDRAVGCGIDGIVAGNTSVDRQSVAGHPLAKEIGGLSGHPITRIAHHTLVQLKAIAQDRLILVGCGGIDDAVAANRRLQAGANLIQLYTGLIYGGPAMARKLIRDLPADT